jgi:hypothetical protein
MTTQEQLAEMLVERWDYQAAQSNQTAKKMLAMDESICKAWETWLETEVFPDTPVFSGYSPKILGRIGRLKAPAVFLLLDWIRREPEAAIQAMRDEFR